MTENEKNTFKKEPSWDAEFIKQIKTQDTLMTIFLNKSDKKTPYPLSNEQLTLGSGKDVKTNESAIFKTEKKLILDKFDCTIEELIIILTALGDIDNQYLKIAEEDEKIKDIYLKDKYQKIHIRLLTPEKGEVLQTIRSIANIMRDSKK